MNNRRKLFEEMVLEGEFNEKNDIFNTIKNLPEPTFNVIIDCLRANYKKYSHRVFALGIDQ